MIKNSNGRIVSEKEKLELENKELVIKDIEGCNCQQETTKKIKKNKKRIKEIEKEEKHTNGAIIEGLHGETIFVDFEDDLDLTALNKEVQDDIIKETNKSI